MGTSVAEALLIREPIPLANIERFIGAGIYAIYYTGNFPPYKEISRKNQGGKFEIPIYVGKAIPAGARKGAVGLDAPPGTALYNRLSEHAESIRQAASTLQIEDFFCRYLVVDDIWIPLGESLLIAKFTPPWNQCIHGFGNHDPGSGRHQQQRSFWDIIHPGRRWALKCAENPKNPEKILMELDDLIKIIMRGE